MASVPEANPDPASEAPPSDAPPSPATPSDAPPAELPPAEPVAGEPRPPVMVVEARARAPRPPIDWGRLAIPLATLLGTAVSLILFVQFLAMEPEARDYFFTTNSLPTKGRDAVMTSLVLGVMLPMLALVVSLFVGRGRAVSFWDRAGRLMGPFLPLCLMPALFNVRFGHANQLIYLIVLCAFVLMEKPLLQRALTELGTIDAVAHFRERNTWLRRLPLPSGRVFFFALVCLASLGYTVFVAYYTIRNHHRLGTTAFDLGIYDNLMYNALHGRPFHSPVLFGPAGGNYIAGHAEFAMLLFVPIYAIRPGPEMMLIIQATVLGFAAVPLYLFARTRLPRPTAAVVAICYLMFAPLHGPNFYDFHWIPLAVFFHFWLYYAIANRKHVLTWIMVAILFAIREDVAVGIALLGLFLLFSGLRPRLGLALAVLSVTWFAIVRFVIMPLAGAWYFQNLYNGLFADGEQSFGSVIKTILTNPLFAFGTLGSEAKLIYVGHMFVPLALLPASRARLLPLAIAGMFFTILTTGYSPTIQISFQYTTHWIPYLFLATVLALVMITHDRGVWARRAALGTMMVAMLAHSYNFGALLQQKMFVGGFSRIEFRMSPEDKKKWAQLRELLAMIPRNASVAATEQETAHVSTRKTVYPLRWPPGPVDYLLIGRSHIGDLSRSSVNAALANPDEYGLLAERGDELFLFKRGHKSPETKAARWKVGVP